MVWDKKPVKESRRPEEEKKSSRPIQEYEFFVQGEGEANSAGLPWDRNTREIKAKSGEQNKSGIFFSSIEETDAEKGSGS